MSFWRYVFDNDHSQRRDIEATRRKLEETSAAAEAAAEDARDASLDASQRLDRLELMLEAVYRHLESQGALTRDQFAALIEQVDLADGNLDGKVGPDVSARAPKCAACGKPVSRRRKTCVYCQAEVVLPKRR